MNGDLPDDTFHEGYLRGYLRCRADLPAFTRFEQLAGQVKELVNFESIHAELGSWNRRAQILFVESLVIADAARLYNKEPLLDAVQVLEFAPQFKAFFNS